MPRAWFRLPYRVQIPLGLTLAVLLTAALVTGVAARAQARQARAETLDRIERSSLLLGAQARPLLAADDTWRVFALLRSIVELLPGIRDGHARAAVLDEEGRVFASSTPERLGTASPLLGGGGLPEAQAIKGRTTLDHEGRLRLIDVIRSEDGQRLGFTYLEVDAAAFAVDWRLLAPPALMGMLIALLLLAPAGWWLGRRMAAPVADTARVISGIGRLPAEELQRALPQAQDPELGRIAAAVHRLITEMQSRQQAQTRALSAERMAAVGRITAAVAHEINNPLAGLLTAVNTLHQHGDVAATRVRSLSLLERGLQQIQATVAALLPQARIEQRALQAEDFDDVLLLAHQVLERLGVRLQTRLDLQVPPRLPSAPIRQVLLNLVLNAAKAAGEGGRVEVELEADAQLLRIRVAHGGESLSAERLAAIVAAERGDDPRGFGLWVCHEMAIAMGGRFAVAARDGPGTTLVFEAPNEAQAPTQEHRI